LGGEDNEKEAEGSPPEGGHDTEAGCGVFGNKRTCLSKN